MERIVEEKFCGFAANSYESCCFENSYELDTCIPIIFDWIRKICIIRS